LIGSEIVLCDKSIFMAGIIGLGGVFIKSADPKALADWYQQRLGINFNGQVYTDFSFTGPDGKPSPGSNVLSFFKSDSPYFAPSEKPVMLNLRVEGLMEFLQQLKANGVTIVGEPLDEEYGKFGWILDPEGNKIELWEPPV
jgi:predicted enzyme related to lactoylglutathione lyase